MKKSFPNVSFKDLCLLIQSNAILHVGNGNFNEEDGLGVEKKINKTFDNNDTRKRFY